MNKMYMDTLYNKDRYERFNCILSKIQQNTDKNLLIARKSTYLPRKQRLRKSYHIAQFLAVLINLSRGKKRRQRIRKIFSILRRRVFLKQNRDGKNRRKESLINAIDRAGKQLDPLFSFPLPYL